MVDLGAAYERYASELRSFARRHVGDDDAEDVVQQVFCEAVAAIDRYEERGHLRAWLYARLRSRCVDTLRRRFRRQMSPLGEYAIDFEEDRLVALIDLNQLQLAPRQAQALWLHYGMDLSLNETARSMECSQPVVKALLHRACERARS